eukprot:CAMPEP_0194132192 /NCGR_PEP_ID=MMETSP0152-20130528/2721_1 /TAXON_ID=1049557 /ORGANISM="Thalassiothrix antarctica, Strain L6-D1" /LENGTH=623 /DNA_ID=CAMNT_0038827157 /DNA_START=171 /DNA_END=2042 /DNA_ORIENTATION=-
MHSKDLTSINTKIHGEKGNSKCINKSIERSSHKNGRIKGILKSNQDSKIMKESFEDTIHLENLTTIDTKIHRVEMPSYKGGRVKGILKSSHRQTAADNQDSKVLKDDDDGQNDHETKSMGSSPSTHPVQGKKQHIILQNNDAQSDYENRRIRSLQSTQSLRIGRNKKAVAPYDDRKGIPGYKDIPSSKGDTKGNRKKKWLVLRVIILIVFGSSFGAVFYFIGRDRHNIQKAMVEIRSLIVSKLPESADVLAEETSPQYKALMLVAEKRIEDPEFYTDKRSIRQYGLMTIFESLMYESDSFASSNECNWNGVSCDDENIELVLQNEVLIGTLPPEIALLPLVRLDLSKNDQIFGSIPTEIGLLSQLQVLVLEENNLSGSIPSEIGLLDNLETLSLQWNEVEGFICSEIGLLNLVKSIKINNNRISGTIPSEIGLLSHVEDIEISSNLIMGSIPSEIGQLNKMRKLSLSNNYQITGSIPSEVGRLSQVENLSLYSNKLSESIPSEIGLLKKMKELHLNWNKISGSIPTEIGLLNQINYLSLRRNIIEGSIPSEIGLLNQLSNLDLSRNKLSGSIPLEIAFLDDITELKVHGNIKLFGSIPNDICKIEAIIKADQNKVDCECCVCC